MSTPHIIIGILLFAAATAVLYAWGLSKSMRQQQDMTRNLLHACGSRVVKYLKKHDTITEKQIAKEIEGVRIGQFWSKKKLQVQDGKKVSGEVIKFLLEQQYMESAGKGVYRLKK
ncbi:MAG: hypothetical protein IKM54_04850 [Butyricicoccus sp.]|nr:hypothetical protein [Butyricicoccus sp.]